MGGNIAVNKIPPLKLKFSDFFGGKYAKSVDFSAP